MFAALLGLNRQFAVEKVDGCHQGILLAPGDRSALYFGKALGNWLFVLTVTAVVCPAFFLFFRVAGPVPMGGLVLFTLMGTAGIVAVGTFLAVLATQTRSSEILLPILLLPVAIPLLIGAVKVTGGLMGGEGLAAYGLWLKLLGAYDLIFTAVPWLLFDYLLEG